ncbi:unnamed protein product, partial [Chrysoparadoxa australica]
MVAAAHATAQAPLLPLISVAERVLSFLSVKDLIDHIASQGFGENDDELVKLEAGHGGPDDGAGIPKRKQKDSHVLAHVFSFLVSAGTSHAMWAIGALSHVADGLGHMLDRVSVLSLVQCALSQAQTTLAAAQYLASLPMVCAKSVVSALLCTVQAMMNVASVVWFELRHLGVQEVMYVVSLLRGESSAPALSSAGLGSFSSRNNSFSCGPAGSARSMRSSSLRSYESSSENGGSAYTLTQESLDPVQAKMQAALRMHLDKVNSTASLISYQEKTARAMPKSHVKRVKRMMHYDISLNPFQATVAVKGASSDEEEDSDLSDDEAEGEEDDAVPVMSLVTPQSFPPTPISRSRVMSRSSQFADDVLYLARDQLRLDQHARCPDETTRFTAEYLKERSQLAVLNGHDSAPGIVLTHGQHCATKVASGLYSSIRAMVPVLHNRYVFFQFSVMAQKGAIPHLSVGLSTQDMPLNTLVGSWGHSIGLCSTGQVLQASRWYGCLGTCAFGVGATVGVLVHLASCQPFASWDGDMVKAYVTFVVRCFAGCPIFSHHSLLHITRTKHDCFFFPLLDLYPTLTLHSPNTQV